MSFSRRLFARVADLTLPGVLLRRFGPVVIALLPDSLLEILAQGTDD